MSKMKLKLLHIPKHQRDLMIVSQLSDGLREQYKRRSIRVIEGDSVKVRRGEYSGIEGKVEKVNTERGTLSIEGIQREKVKGGNVKVQIHASNVTIVGLNLADKYRENKLQSDGKKKKEDGKQEIEEKKPSKNKSKVGKKRKRMEK